METNIQLIDTKQRKMDIKQRMVTNDQMITNR